jgi:hypothetical protein
VTKEQMSTALQRLAQVIQEEADLNGVPIKKD